MENDLISRQAAIDALNSIDNLDAKARGGICINLMGLPSVQPEPHWIPVSKKLPEDYVDVLVWLEYFRYGNYNCMYATYGIGNYSKEYNSWTINHETGWKDLHVFAWMPLPEPYPERRTDDGELKKNNDDTCRYDTRRNQQNVRHKGIVRV